VRFSSQVANFNPSHLHFVAPLGVIPFEFRREIWCRNIRVSGLSCGIICVILRLAVLIQYRSVTDTRRDTRRRHTSRALSIASRGKPSKALCYNHFTDCNTILTSSSAMAEGPRDALVSRNSATTKYPYRMALFA